MIFNKNLMEPENDIKNEIFDVAVIGGGPAGYVAAIKAAQLGGKVALIEKDKVGGTCLNRGCIPTKVYLRNSEIIHDINYAEDRGIILKNKEFEINIKKVVNYKNTVVNTLVSGIESLIKSNEIKYYKGIGKILKDKNIQIGSETIKAYKIILAGGSAASKINIPGIENKRVLTSDEILDLKTIPKSLVVIGGGVVGVELSMVYNSYGTKVTIIEAMDRIIPFMDMEISSELKKKLFDSGIKIITGSSITSIKDENEKLILYLQGNKTLEADYALLSIGRISDLEGVGNIKFEMNKGRIKVNEKMETSESGIYAPGDINGLSMLAHAASKMGEVAAINAMGGNDKANLKYVPKCIYTIPEVGSVGLTEEEAKEKYDINIGRFPFKFNGRALASGQTDGFIKVIVDRKYGELLGVHIIGPSAAEIINEVAALMQMEITAEEIVNIIHGHPTFSECFMESVAHSLGKCIHLPKNN